MSETEEEAEETLLTLWCETCGVEFESSEFESFCSDRCRCLEINGYDPETPEDEED